MKLGVAVKGVEFVPGDVIPVRIEVGTGADKHLQAIRLELGYKNTYYERTRDSDGDSHDTRTSDDVVVATKEMPADHPELAGGEATFETTLELPAARRRASRSGSSGMSRRSSTASCGAIAARRSGILVLAPRADEAGAQSPGWVGDKCEMRLEIASRVARPGETLTGVLHVEPRAAFDVRRVRVDLECRMHHEDNIVRELGDDVELTLADRASFAAGVAQEFPFSITVPAGAAPTLRARHSSVRWQLKGVCDRAMRGDYDVASELLVYNG